MKLFEYPVRGGGMRGQSGWLTLLVLASMLHSAPAWALEPDRSLTQYACRAWDAQHGFPGDAVSSITQTRDGFLWIGTRKGLVRYDGLEFKLLPLPAIPQFQFPVISALAPSADGGLWFGIENGFLGHYRTGQGFHTLTNATWYLPGMGVLALRETRDGALWVGTSGGTFRLGKDGAVASFPQLMGCITILEDSRQRVWLGLRGGAVFCWQDGKLNPDLHISLGDDIAQALAEDSAGRLWIATQRSLRCYDSALRPQPVPSMPGSQTQLLTDSHGVLWVGTGEGLYRWTNGALTSLRQSNGLAEDIVSALFEDRQGNLWVGGRNGLSLLSDVRLPVFGDNEGLPKAWFLAVCPSTNGGLWAASSAGICRFDGKTALGYSTESGLSNTWIKRVFEARDGRVYLLNGNREVEVFREGKVVGRYSYKHEWLTALAEDPHGLIISAGPELCRLEGDTH